VRQNWWRQPDTYPAFLRQADEHRYLGAVGILGGGAYLLTCLGSVVQMQQLVDVAVGLGGLILAPIWYVGFGIVMITWSRS